MLPGSRQAGTGAGHRLVGAPSVGRGPAGLLEPGRGDRRRRMHQQQLRPPRRPRSRNRRGALRRGAGAGPAARGVRGLRIAHVAPVATSVPPQKSGSVQTMTSLLTEGLVGRGHDVTLFAPGHSITRAKLHATFPLGYREDESMWPWEMYELLNLAAAVERADEFDIIHYEAEYFPMSLAFTRLSRAPVSQTLHHAPDVEELTLWRRYPDAPFIAISREQARLLDGLNIAAVVPHGIDTDRFVFNPTPGEYLLF